MFDLLSFRGVLRGGGGGDHFGNIRRTYVTCETERLKHVALSLFFKFTEPLQRIYIVVIDVNIFGVF